MQGLVFYSSTDTKGKRDATGAFIPEARAFARFHDIPSSYCIGVDCKGLTAPERRKVVIDEISKRELWDVIAFFGHGWPDGIQFGFTRKTVDDLAGVIAAHSSPDVCVGLFACLAAENDVRDSTVKKLGPATDGGFADMLRDSMVRHGVSYGWVDAHKTAGHTSWNPYVVRFLCEDVDDPEWGAEGGAWLVEPRSALWKKWVAALRDRSTGLRYGFLISSEFAIKQYLLTGTK
ncbi:MAG: hypothetical protein PHI12_09680 [Dehalococcoidales bacterium]|nr:hypothetical protein [Dehalococcoidales bacterium]